MTASLLMSLFHMMRKFNLSTAVPPVAINKRDVMQIDWAGGKLQEIMCCFLFVVRGVGQKHSCWSHLTVKLPKEKTQTASVSAAESLTNNLVARREDTNQRSKSRTSSGTFIAEGAGESGGSLMPAKGTSDRQKFDQHWVKRWLSIKCGNLGRYAQLFIDEGFDSIDQVEGISKGDLNEMGVRPGRVKLIMREVNVLKSAPICHITKTTPVDPCRASDGQVYEYSAIMKWLEERDTSPWTRLQMKNKEVTRVDWNGDDWDDMVDGAWWASALAL
jgi:hypothetical protein